MRGFSYDCDFFILDHFYSGKRPRLDVFGPEEKSRSWVVRSSLHTKGRFPISFRFTLKIRSILCFQKGIDQTICGRIRGSRFFLNGFFRTKERTCRGFECHGLKFSTESKVHLFFVESSLNAFALSRILKPLNFLTQV